MLVLSRMVGERVVIGDPSRPIGFVSVESIGGDKVRIGFHFPPNVEVHREEIAERITAERGGGPSAPPSTGPGPRRS